MADVVHAAFESVEHGQLPVQQRLVAAVQAEQHFGGTVTTSALGEEPAAERHGAASNVGMPPTYRGRIKPSSPVYAGSQPDCGQVAWSDRRLTDEDRPPPRDVADPLPTVTPSEPIGR
ncbi:hypothetical protein ABZS66_47230 [Dactylosporangium sp. NPDC005572]|uniref:hypothetical protein n=1 Tax=Dactylosporangium sp. NPDC005572 TaxID=3156889 RepID=UPI0033B3A00C